MGLFPNDNRALFLNQIMWLVIFMATGFVIIWIFTFPTDLVLLIVLFVLMSVYNRRIMLKKLGLLDTSHVKGVKGYHYFNHQLHLLCLVAAVTVLKSNTSVCLVGMSTRKYLFLNVDQR